MRGITKVLAVVDTRKPKQLALNRARQFCRTAGAKLHILSTNPKPGVESMLALEAMAAPLMDEGMEVYLHEDWKGSIADTIIHVRQVERCHMVIKDARPFKPIKNTFVTPQDWSLLRRSRVPVLLVKTDAPWEHSPVLASINADPNDHHHCILNKAILDYASELSDTYSSPLHLATAYPTTRLAIQDSGDGVTDRDAYMLSCLNYARSYHLNEDNLFVEPGPTESLIPKLIKQTGARLLVLGTHARVGISALAIGNTAEHLISEINIDMLVLQPRHHMIPLERQLNR